jgi:hypothetical protein
MVGSEEGVDGGRDGKALVRSGASKGGCMQTAQTIYESVQKRVHKTRRSFKSCCRSVAEKFHIEPEEVEVVMVSKSDVWYKKLGYNAVINI